MSESHSTRKSAELQDATGSVSGEQADGAWPEDEDAEAEEKAGETSAEGLRQELARARRERDDFEAQYKGLLGKLTQMRSTLGERLRQDAVRTSSAPPRAPAKF